MKSNISALMDGELEKREIDRVLKHCSEDAEARDAWCLYHLVGDAMRSTGDLSAEFGKRFSVRLSGEPTVVAPRRWLHADPEHRRWYLMSAAASLAAVALVAGVVMFEGAGHAPVAPAQVARSAPAPAPAPAVKVAKAPRIPLPSGASDLLFAHQTYAPRVALQGVVQYVRTVSDTGVDDKDR